MVLQQGVRSAGMGIALGLGVALVSARLLDSLVFGVSTRDPLTFAVVPVILLAVALLAAYLPARRATRVDPVTALRAE